MARATRSSVQHHDKDKTALKLPESKKRKRTSDAADEPAQKLQRTDAPPYAATRPIPKDHAHKILHALQMIDKQGLLDRVYPLEQSSSSAIPQSLRTLLEDSEEHTLSALRTAVKNLQPISVQSRGVIPPIAAQQQRFCDIALSLLEQASFNPISLDIESLVLQDEDDDASKPLATSTKRYALMQHLPSGDYWTSAPPDLDPEDAKRLSTGHADLVAIFPTPSATSTSALPKLGDYSRPVAPRQKPASKWMVTCGSFLDYGPWTSFAPTWDQNGREVGRRQMGEVLAQKARLYRERLQARQRALELQQTIEEKEKEQPLPQPETPEPPDVDSLQDILSPEEIESLKSVLGSLELENAVQELLNRNRRALQRLGQLQVQRLKGPGGRTSTVKESDEEWDVAQGILDSLTVLASLRPRSSAHPTAPLCPPPAALHTLMNTLPRSAVPGWHGTLSTRSALRDDATVKVRPGVPATAPVAAAPIPAAPVYGTYNNYYSPQPGGRATPVAATQYRYPTKPQQGQYYPQGGYGSTTNQLPYGYTGGGGWFNSYGAGTPTGTPAAAGTYGAFFGTTSGTATPVAGAKAVANTVMGKNTPQGWVQSGTPTATALPAHLRAAVGAQYTPS
ncbi:hypothetical protein FB45DRAFT_915553 [Roridomyces roridus]|uniref:Uncharacterized protein n=1 Tax=Roridomyces roridus TaxID=1738132 RepID=A0AAD7FKW6_9AGAR|nr:hypothetical protein FB45DRAFT_915553 [Roridomyces roridus]